MRPENKFEQVIEKYRYWIGGILILAIVGGSAVLIWRENYKMPSLDGRIKNLESRITELEQERNKIQETSIQTNSNDQSSNNQTEQGRVAGTTTQNTDNSKQITAKQPVTGKININTATAAELDTLPGIGPAYAGRIIDYRNTHGGFKTIDELDNVSGIGVKTIDKMRELITVN